MSRVYVTSDWHLGHEAVLRFRPRFKSVQEHDDHIITNMQKVIRPGDKLYILGDIAFTREAFQRVKQIYCNKVLILGNHDTEVLDILDMIRPFQEIHSYVRYKRAELTHIPIHPSELRHDLNIHGHIHNKVIDDPRYYNVCVEQTDYLPVPIKEILGESKS